MNAEIEKLLGYINMDSVDKAGFSISSIILISSIIFEAKILNNSILALYSLSSLFFFSGNWANITKEAGIFQGHRYHREFFKISIVGGLFYLIFIVLLILAIFYNYKLTFT